MGSSILGKAERLHLRAMLCRFARKFNAVVRIAGVVVDMYGLHGTKWDPGARWASSGSCGGLIIFLHHEVGAGCQMGWATCGFKVPNGHRVPGGLQNTCKSKYLARTCNFSVGTT